MILPDVNVLLYAFRSDSREHGRFHEWLEAVVNEPAAYGISPQVLAAVVRVSTHPRVFAQPSTLDEALGFCRMLLEQPNATLVVPGDCHWSIFDTLCRDAAATGNLAGDAWFAALAIESGSTWVTTDRDYARFRGLAWRAPF